MLCVIVHYSTTYKPVRSQSSYQHTGVSYLKNTLSALILLFCCFCTEGPWTLWNCEISRPFLIRAFWLSLHLLLQRGDSSPLDCYPRRSDAWSEIPASPQTSNVGLNMSLCLFAPQFLNSGIGIRALPHP